MCNYIFYWIKTPFFSIFARPAEKLNSQQELSKKLLFSQEF